MVCFTLVNVNHQRWVTRTMDGICDDREMGIDFPALDKSKAVRVTARDYPYNGRYL